MTNQNMIPFRLQGLTHVVQCHAGKTSAYQAWETIAAFNVKIVAFAYARDCRKSNGKTGLRYRVRSVQESKAS